jgi:hypothetical protein
MTTLVVTAALIYVLPGYSYLAESSLVNGQLVGDHWPSTSLPINWQINNNLSQSGTTANIAGTPTTAEQAIINGFNTWVNAPNTSLAVNTPVVNTAITNINQIPANMNFVCFICTGGSFGQDGTLAVTSTFSTSGQITHAYILFNPNPTTGGTPPKPICFTVAGATNCPTVVDPGNHQDLQTVATHEIGHFLGLDHSGVVRAVMFPQAPQIQLAISYDDVAGISSLYPTSSPTVPTGSISGTVTMAGGGPVFGAHVVANSMTSAVDSTMSAAGIRKSPIGTLTHPDGTYTIAGLPADSYLVIAEPLDGPASASAMDWGTTFNQSIFTGFTTRWH